MLAEHLSWLLSKGIDVGMADTIMGVHSDGDALCFPYPGGRLKKRYGFAEGEKRRFSFEGGTPCLYGQNTGQPATILCEGESDTLRLMSEFERLDDDPPIDVLGIPGIDTWQASWAQEIKGEQVYVILDNDQDYNVRERVNDTWRRIRRDLGPRAQRVHLPNDVKDLCEFFDNYTVDVLRDLFRESEQGKAHFEALDLSVAPDPPDWLVEGLIAKGDVALLQAMPNVGKSWFSMSLAVALAEGKSHWLQFPVHEHGRVLYVDEENPHDVVHDRLWRLGLTPEGSQNIRYLHRQGIRLDRAPEKLIDEALIYQPSLIVIDSLTRVHTIEENSAGEIARLFNDGINPLARESGATVLLLHHTNKSESNNSFIKTRGSSDITASPDSGFEILTTDMLGGQKQLRFKHFKTRRGALVPTFGVILKDVEDEVHLEVGDLF